MLCCYGTNKKAHTACGSPNNWREGPHWTSSIHKVTCPDCLQELLKKQVGKRDKLFKQDHPQMQAVAILGGIEGHIINMESGVIPSEKSQENLRLLISQLKTLHKHYLPESW